MPKPVIELESQRLMAAHCHDRPTFQGNIGNRRFQVFCFEETLLFIDLGTESQFVAQGSGTAGAVVGGLCFGMVGAAVGRTLEQSMSGPSKVHGPNNIRNSSDEELIAYARKNRHSFLVPKDAIKRISITAASSFERMFAKRKLQGVLRLKAKKVGTVHLEFNCYSEMGTAIETLPTRLPCDCPVNAAFHKRRRQYVRR